MTEEDLADVLCTLCAGDITHQGNLVQPPVSRYTSDASGDHRVPPIRTHSQAATKGSHPTPMSPLDAHDPTILPHEIAHLKIGLEFRPILHGAIQKHGVQDRAPDGQAVGGGPRHIAAPRVGRLQGAPGGRVDCHPVQRSGTRILERMQHADPRQDGQASGTQVFSADLGRRRGRLVQEEHPEALTDE